MKFITLTENEGLKILVNPIMITTLQEVRPSSDELLINTKVYTVAGDRRHVRETIEEIQKLIKESENITTVTWKTGTTPNI
jgi:uncharacterized protein YlzI (FlbEa/FlbD family)